MGFLALEGKHVLIMGVANKKSVACRVAETVLAEGARVFVSVQDETLRAGVAKILPQAELFVCDVAEQEAIDRLAADLRAQDVLLDGLVHSIAFARYGDGPRPFHETRREDFVQALDVSMFSLVALAGALKDRFSQNASVVTMSIPDTRLAWEGYGFMAPVKAALDAAVCFLAKSFSHGSRVRFNSVNPGPLKTRAAAGIPGFLDSYIYAEKLTLRKQALDTQEVANVVAFLLSERASGINAQAVVVDAGMGVNAFDQEVIDRVTRLE